MVKINWIWIASALFMISVGCSDPDIPYQRTFEIPGGRWAHDHILQDTWECVTDIYKPYIVFKIHFSSDFGYQNLYLRTQWTNNDAEIFADTFSIQLFDPTRGGWLGNQNGNNFVLSDTISIQDTWKAGDLISYQTIQFGREEQVRGISEVQIQLLKSEM